LTDKIKKLREQMRELDRTKEQLKHGPDGQRSTTDPDARSMNSQAKGSGLVGYNVQAAVDARHHLIVAHEVTNVGNDRSQLGKMAKVAREAMDKTKLQALADRGYFNGKELKACEDVGIVTFVPKPMTSNAKAEGRFDESDFIYIAKDDEYQCPAGDRPSTGSARSRKWPQRAPLLDERLPQVPDQGAVHDKRLPRIRRWEHEEVLERVHQRLDRKPVAMTLRRCTVEHVFGTLKHWMGWTHFLTKKLEHVNTEMCLHVLAYDLKRVIAILGMSRTMKAIRLMGASRTSTIINWCDSASRCMSNAFDPCK
jgi:hypothetical protein